jgi:hypothetical protein
MAMGWPQPQTAAITVMLIAATGAVSASLQKGVSRVLGTVAGAVIGLSLIALFPQDRMLYLLIVSLVVSFIIYLYNAYQRDSTVFMLTAVVTLMVFNGGDAEGAFIYGVDRAFMTVFGVLVYTLVASLLWPVRSEDNTHALARDAIGHFANAFYCKVGSEVADPAKIDEQLSTLLAAQEAFQTQFSAAGSNSDAVAAYLPEWNTVAACYEDIEDLLVPALKQPPVRDIDLTPYIADYERILAQIGAMFDRIRRAWDGTREGEPLASIPVEIRPGSLVAGSHLTVAAVASRVEMLERIQAVLQQLDATLGSLLFDEGSFGPARAPRGKPAFIWLDQENFKTALRAFVTFWIACGIWIQFNPPGGFTLVTLCTILIPLVSYTPVTPKLLFILFSLGFAFALPAYIFLLPAMTHWVELAGFLFAYAFLGFYVLKGPVSIFFLLGLFTLGIQNTMNYNFNGILLTILMFYMICALLIISIHFPFTSKPERIYAGLRRRFFYHCGRLAAVGNDPTGSPRWTRLRLRRDSALLAKLHHWGSRVDSALFPSAGPTSIGALNRQCDLLQSQLLVLLGRANEFAQNPLIAAGDSRARARLFRTLCDELARNRYTSVFDETQENLAGLLQRLDDHLGSDYLERYSTEELAQFYVYLDLQVSILSGLYSCLQAQQALDWGQLGEARF